MGKFALKASIAFYIIVIPVYLLSMAFDNHFSLARELQAESWREKMTDSLDVLSNYHTDEVFFHGMLQNTFKAVDKADNPLKRLSEVFESFDQYFPGAFKFIVWNDQGSIVDDLSFERHFRYVLRITRELLAKIFKETKKLLTVSPENMELAVNRIGLMRGYFGQFLMKKHLADPFYEDYLGSAIRASQDADKGLLWYGIYNNFGIIAFINRSLMDQRLGPQLITDSYNTRSSDIKLATFDLAKNKLYGVDPEHETEIAMQAVSYSSSAHAFRRSDNFLLLFRQVSPFLIVISTLNKTDHLIDPSEESNRYIFQTLWWLLILAYFIYCLSLKVQSIHLNLGQKLLLFLAFSNGLPLMMLISSGYEFFEQKKNSMISNAQNESVRLLQEFDNRYPAGRAQMSIQLNEFIEKNNRLYGKEIWPEQKINELKKINSSLYPAECYLFSPEGDQIFYTGRDALASSVRFVRDFFSGILRFANCHAPHDRERKQTTLEIISDEAEIYHGALHYIGTIKLQNYGSGARWAYLQFLGEIQTGNSWGILITAWDSFDLQRTFLRSHLKKINKQIYPRKITVMEIPSETIFPEPMKRTESLYRIKHRTQNRGLTYENAVTIDGREHLVATMRGIELTDAVLAMSVPASVVFEEINILFYKLLLALFSSSAMIIGIAVFFSKKLIVPATELREGIKALAARKFNYKINYHSDDEFGELITAFNETIEGMKELAIGTAVQESLLPPEKMTRKNIELFARSIFMTKMGGDYYDYFEISDNKTGIFFGDVAGHGIPAAMIMAMAKAVIANCVSNYESPSEVLTTANEIFVSLKKKGWKRMMTALSLEINNVTGEFTIANAGQCFALVINLYSKKYYYCKAVGMPLGNKLRRPYNPVKGQLEPGDIMILYSDGIIEATNKDGEVFDFSRFEKLVKDSCKADLEHFWQSIYTGHCNWSQVQDDDITFLMIGFKTSEKK